MIQSPKLSDFCPSKGWSKLAHSILVAATIYIHSAHAAPTAANIFAPTVQAYAEGDITAAINDLGKIATGPNSIDDEISARLFLADICTEDDDFSCLITNNNELFKLYSQVSDQQKKTAYWLQISPSFTRGFVYTPNFGDQDLPKIFDIWNHVPFGKIQPDKYLYLQQSAIDYAAFNLDFVVGLLVPPIRGSWQV